MDHRVLLFWGIGTMHEESSEEKNGLRYRLLENTSFLRFYFKKYIHWMWIGLSALFLVNILDLFLPLIIKSAIDQVLLKKSNHLLILAFAYLFISLVQGLCRYAWRMYLIRSSIFSGRDLRAQYTDQLFHLSSSFFDQHRTGDLMSLATNDVESVRIALGTGVLVLVDALFYVLTLPVVMWMLSPQLTLWTCFPLLLIPFVALRNEKEIHRRFTQAQDSLGRVSSFVQESFGGIRLTKAFADEEVQIGRMKILCDELRELNLRVSKIQCTTGPLMDFLMSLGLVILIFGAGRMLILEPAAGITLGTFVAFQRYIQKLVWPMSALGVSMNYFHKAFASTHRLKGILSKPRYLDELGTHFSSRIVHQRLGGGIELRGLSFAYPQDPKKFILKDLNLSICPGEKVAIFGGVGSGKSTLLSLIPGLYLPNRGMLLIDDIDIHDWSLEMLRESIGYVTQETFLFSESILENLAFGLTQWIHQEEQTVALKNQIEQAAQRVMMYEEIERLPLSFSTPLTERGGNLSGGQRQRLSIARALAKQPSILILDDALSSVDLATEQEILKSLRVENKERTELSASQRISSLRNADKIVVLHQGELVQMGSHQELIRTRSGRYWNLFEKQQIQEELEAYASKI
jgi:ATP-binding cassette subfamily B multidrug efflux pump